MFNKADKSALAQSDSWVRVKILKPFTRVLSGGETVEYAPAKDGDPPAFFKVREDVAMAMALAGAAELDEGPAHIKKAMAELVAKASAPPWASSEEPTPVTAAPASVDPETL